MSEADETVEALPFTADSASDAAAQARAPRPLAPGLYLVATPIGNLEDITLRALRVLRSVDRIACEDTRQTAKLLHHFGIEAPTVSYHLHNEQGRGAALIEALRAGARLALVSDAGMPAIADPGLALVQAAIASGVPVFPVPGANAALSALIGSGLPTESFVFQGFLPAKEGQRRSTLESLRASLVDATGERAPTQIFYEAPHRILDTLTELADVFGPAHPIVLARELTKLHEEFLRGPVGEVLAELKHRPAVRGEMVLLLSGEHRPAIAGEDAAASLVAQVEQAMHGGLSEKDALKQVAKARGVGKSEAYREWQRRGGCRREYRTG